MPYPGRILAIDYGTRRLGIAVSDPTQLIAQGVATLTNNADLFRNLISLVREHQPMLIIVGMPYSPDGGKGAKAREVEQFIGDLGKAVDLRIDTWDESYSSVAAHKVLRDSGMKRKRRREKGRVDEMAARLMLQEYLDHQRDIGVHNS